MRRHRIGNEEPFRELNERVGVLQYAAFRHLWTTEENEGERELLLRRGPRRR